VSVTVTVNGKSGPSVVATSGDTISANVTKNTAVNVSASAAAAPGGIGLTGPQGPPSTTITVGNVSTLSAGSSATVAATSSNNGANLTLAFGIPAGATGSNGITPTISVSASTLSAGCLATVAATSSNGGANVALAFGIPQGATGAGGSNLTLSDATPANLGTASAGSSNLVARADHVHSLPVIAYSNLSGVPANFPTNTTLVSGLNASYSGINHGHNYVTSINGIAGALTLAPGPNVTISSNNLTLTIDSIGGGISQNDSIDGGDYIGQILGGITFATQPQSQTLTLAGFSLTFSALNVTATGTPSTWLPDGGTFALNDNLSPASTLGAVAFNSGLLANYRRLDANGTQYAALLSSTNNGATWTEALLLDTGGGFGAGAFDISRKISLASNGTRTLITTGISRAFDSQVANAALVMRRVDGSNLSNAVQTTQQYAQVVYLPSAQLFLAIGFSGSAIYRSPDGVAWTEMAIGVGGPRALHVVNGIAVAMLTTGAVRSTDGVQWSSTTVYTDEYGTPGYQSSASSATRVVWIDSSGVARCSSDGSAWVASSSASFASRVTYAAGVFWAFSGTSSSTAHTSPDGVTWTARTLPAASRVVDAAAAGASGPVVILGTAPALATVSGATASANLSVSATSDGGAAVSYQWQRSLDAGTTWSNVANATTSSLSLNLSTADSGTRYRALASATGASTLASQSAILTVTG